MSLIYVFCTKVLKPHAVVNFKSLSYHSLVLQSGLHKNNAVIATKKMKEGLSGLISQSVIHLSQNINSEFYPKVWKHRTAYYEAMAPHLLKDLERKQEAELDQRGLIFMVSSQGEVLASLRLIKRPFEVDSYQLHGADLSTYQNYWEIGRLTTNPLHDGFTVTLLVQYLLCSAGLEMFTSMGCEGLIGICKPSTLKFFTRFGLSSIGTAFNKNRGIEYHVIKGSITQVLRSTESLLLNKNKIYKRLQKVLEQSCSFV